MRLIVTCHVQADGVVAEARAGYAAAREAVRKASGVRVLLAALAANQNEAPAASLRRAG